MERERERESERERYIYRDRDKDRNRDRATENKSKEEGNYERTNNRKNEAMTNTSNIFFEMQRRKMMFLVVPKK